MCITCPLHALSQTLTHTLARPSYLIWIRCIDTIITFIADAIAVQIRLIRIRYQRTVIVFVQKEVIVNVIVASIADTVFIEIQLIIVNDLRTIVTRIAL